tara:strand:+ start:185 stop:871 length:687 start_codon:yes stop_codon:yes gene_type:complete
VQNKNKFTHIVKYDLAKYNFPKILCDKFEVKGLNALHTHLDNKGTQGGKMMDLGNDTHSKFHNIFYRNMNSYWPDFHDTWRSFIIEVIKPTFPEEEKIIYQSFPSFRIQYPNSKAIWVWHYDNDGDHGHPLGEINVMIPLTKMFGTNTVWKESISGLADYSPLQLSPGELALWNGNRCKHGNKINETGVTRVSFDIRVLPRKFYKPDYSGKTATTGKSYTIGGYYSEI